MINSNDPPFHHVSQQPVKPWMSASSAQQDTMYPMRMMAPYNQQSHWMFNGIHELQQGSQHLTNTLSTTMASLSNFVQLVDTAVYSAWSSLTSVLALLSTLSSFNERYLKSGLQFVLHTITKLIKSMFGYRPPEGHVCVDGRKIATIILGAALTLSFLVRRALKDVKPDKLVACQAVYPFSGGSGKLSLRVGDIVSVDDDDRARIGHFVWLRGWRSDRKSGLFPANYVQIKQE